MAANITAKDAPALLVGCPNGSIMTSAKATHLAIPAVPKAANQARVFDELKSGNLLSIGQLCDNNCTATFNKQSMHVNNANGEEVLQGPRDARTGLWTVQIPMSNSVTAAKPPDRKGATVETANGVIRKKTTKSELAEYIHASLGSPAPSTLIDAVNKGFLTSIPGLDADLIQNHLPKSIASMKGHLQQTRQNIQSTKPICPVIKQENPSSPAIKPEIDNLLVLDEGPVKTNEIMAAIIDTSQPGKVYGDLTGRYPIESNKGNNYILVIYHCDANAILAEPLKSRNKGDILNAYRKIHAELTAQGLKPQLQTLDNEASDILIDYMRKNKIDLQLAPPHIHRRILAERAIRTFKDHFIATRATCDPQFPPRLWCRLIPQAVMTLNLLRQSRIHPKLSAYNILYGNFDFNKTPLGPPGTRVLVHEKPRQRGTWADHGVEGWYCAPAIHHYRCYSCYIPSTNRDRISDTVEFFPTVINMPKLSSQDKAIQAIREVIHTIRNPGPATPFPTFGNKHSTALEQLATIFETSEEVALPPAAPTTRVPIQAPSKQPIQHAPTTRVPLQMPSATSTSIAPTTRVPRQPSPPIVSDDDNSDDESEDEAEPPIQRKQHTYNTRRHSAAVPHRYRNAAMNHIIRKETEREFANTVIDPTSGTALEYADLITNVETRAVWEHSAANEFGRLAQGVGDRVEGTNTIHFIKRSQVPADRVVTYAKFVCSIREQKKETHRTRLTVGGNLIDFPGEVSTPTADMLTAKLLINSILSTPNAKFAGADLKDCSLFLTAIDFDVLQLFLLAALLILACSNHSSLFLTALLAFSSSASLYL